MGKHNPKRWENLSGRVEVFLVRPVSEDGLTWEALVRPGRKMRTGEVVRFDDRFPRRFWGATSTECGRSG